MLPGVEGALIICVVLLPLMLLTATGERRRGHGVLTALVAGVFFPITWGAWYLRDEPRRPRAKHSLDYQ